MTVASRRTHRRATVDPYESVAVPRPSATRTRASPRPERPDCGGLPDLFRLRRPVAGEDAGVSCLLLAGLPSTSTIGVGSIAGSAQTPPSRSTTHLPDRLPDHLVRGERRPERWRGRPWSLRDEWRRIGWCPGLRLRFPTTPSRSAFPFEPDSQGIGHDRSLPPSTTPRGFHRSVDPRFSRSFSRGLSPHRGSWSLDGGRSPTPRAELASFTAS